MYTFFHDFDGVFRVVFSTTIVAHKTALFFATMVLQVEIFAIEMIIVNLNLRR
jgi:hypothetical protein